MTTIPQINEQEAQSLAQQTYQLQVNSPESLEEAQRWFLSIRKKRKEIETKFDEPMKGMNAQLKKMREALKSFTQPLNEAETWLSTQVNAYKRKQAEKARQQQIKEMEKYQARREKAEAKGKDPDVVSPPKVVEMPRNSSTFDEGQAITRKTKKVRFLKDPSVNSDTKPDVYLSMDIAKDLPANVFKLDWARLNQQAKAGADIPGIEVYTEETLVGRA